MAVSAALAKISRRPSPARTRVGPDAKVRFRSPGTNSGAHASHPLPVRWKVCMIVPLAESAKASSAPA